MKIALSILELYTPATFRKKILRRLLSATARAFGADVPPTKGLSPGRLLQAYALFTREQSEKLWMENRDEDEVAGKLFQNAFDLGAALRRGLRVRSREDVIRASRVLYRVLGISFEGRTDGRVAIRDCYFSRFYTARLCRLVSALDAGAAAGISDGGRLEFSQRMTEGHDSCLARLVFEDGPS
jgi:hypothetical protein